MINFDIIFIFLGISFCVYIIIILKLFELIKLIYKNNGMIYISEICGNNSVSGVEFNIENMMIFFLLNWFVNGFLKKVFNILVIINVNMKYWVFFIDKL